MFNASSTSLKLRHLVFSCLHRTLVTNVSPTATTVVKLCLWSRAKPSVARWRWRLSAASSNTNRVSVPVPDVSVRFRQIHSSSVQLHRSLKLNIRFQIQRFCSATTSTSTMPEKAEKPVFHRLPKDVIPSLYVLRLKPDLKAFTFEGREEITLQVKNEVTNIILNSAEIKVTNVQYKGASQVFDSEAIKVSYSSANETVSFGFPQNIQVGAGTLTITFEGHLNDKMRGFYRCKYSAANGEDRYAAVTQFEATDARRAFPCWDEPAVKAAFDITLVVPKDLVALSNMPVKTESPLEGDPAYRVVHYDPTPIMSTYLVAFVIGEYDSVEETDADGVLVRVFTPPGKREQGRFALQVAVKTLPFYHKYFQIAYPLPKIDLIAIADFASGAMENWGLVTCREVALLIDPANSSASSRQWVALVVGHELAHMWFGNLVTMEWWTHLWLNEGFASWIEYLCVDHCYPQFDIWTQFASATHTRALELDALQNSHPIEVSVGHPCEVDEIFDLISYSKGASLIRMLHDYIGDEDYRRGMTAYLKKHSYGNTFTEDLWAALGDASAKPVQAIMSTWTLQMGFPVLKVSEVRNGRSRVLTIRQEKFSADGATAGDSLWMVPVSVVCGSKPNDVLHQFVLEDREKTITLNDVEPGDWLKLNAGAVGYYRTRYSSEMLDALLPGIKDGSLAARDRLGLQNDIYALARAGAASTVDFLKVALAFSSDEANYTVWSDVASSLAAVAIMLQHTPADTPYKGFLAQLFTPVSARLGWQARTDEGPLDAMLRSLVIGRLGRCGDEKTVKEAQRRFTAHCSGDETLAADLRASVYSTVLAHGDEVEYDAMMKLFEASELHEEKRRILCSLGAVTNPVLIERVLEFAMSSSVRSQDTVFVIGGVAGTVQGREAAWKFVQGRWPELCSRYEGGSLLARLIKLTTENFATPEMEKEVQEFFEKNPVPIAQRTVQQSLENIRLNRCQLERDADAILKYLDGRA